MAGDWLKLHRKAEHSAAMSCHKTGWVWIRLLMKACWRESQLLDGRVLQPGQLIINQRKFAKEIDLTRQKLRTALANLEKCGNLTQESTQKGTVITICNWSTYQDSDQPPNPASNPKPTQSQPKANPSLTLLEEVKKERTKEGKKNLSCVEERFSTFWSAYPTRNGRRLGKKKALDAFSKLSAADQLLAITAAEAYAQGDEAARGFAKDPCRFFTSSYWRDWLEQPVDGPNGPVVSADSSEPGGSNFYPDVFKGAKNGPERPEEVPECDGRPQLEVWPEGRS